MYRYRTARSVPLFLTALRAALGPIVVALIAALAHAPLAAAEPPAVPDTLAQRIAPCTQCHGDRGQGMESTAYYPRLAGKPAGYLYRQLLNFADGHRRYPQMNYLVRQLPAPYLLEIARYFSTLHPPYPGARGTPLPSADAALADRLIRQGDRARDLPPCTACHGDALSGVEPATPGLVGLYASYIAEQLNAWRNGVRHAREPDCMARIAKRLTGGEIQLISGWLASRPTEPEPVPAAASKAPPPLECGSLRALDDR